MKVGCIGCGNMASALIGGILKGGVCQVSEIWASDKAEETRKRAQGQWQIHVSESNQEVVQQADVVILAVKPQYYQTVIQEIRDSIRPEHLVISIAPGKTLQWLEEQFDRPVRLVRTMPNTPAMIGKGMTALCANAQVDTTNQETAEQILGSIGACAWIDEHLMDAVVGVSGSAPAYVFLMIEAMADAAVIGGMPRQMAYQFASQAVEGSAAMVRELQRHPGELKDMVCSPAGTTIQAVRVLEERGFRSALIESICACMDKAGKM